MMDEWMQKRIDFSKQYQANQEKEMSKTELEMWDANQEQVQLDELKRSFQKIHEKARNDAETLIKTHKLDQVSDMVLEALIDDLMMERDARTWAFEAETNFYKDVGI
jgi:phosphomevalonate kinase